MIISLHRPEGIINIDSDTVTDEQLAELGLTRADFNSMIPREPLAEIDTLKARVEKLEKK